MPQSAVLSDSIATPNELERPAQAEARGPAIDLVHLSRQTLGDSALESELLSLFDRQAQQFVTRLGTPFRPEEAKWRGDLAHTLKGSASAVGAFGVSRAAQLYEEAVRAALSDSPARFKSLSAAIEAARTAIARLLERSVG